MENRARTVLIDAHVHLYPQYDIKKWTTSAILNLSDVESGQAPVRILLIVDRTGQNSRSVLLAGGSEDTVVENFEHFPAISIRDPLGSLIAIVGCQSVAREGIEVLGFGLTARPPDGAPARDQIDFIIGEGGVPCLPWSPGKWLGKRGKVVYAMFDTFGPQVLTVGDIAIRSQWGPPSSLLRHARSSGFPVLFGSDPLPINGEEKMVGSFGMHMTSECSDKQIIPWVLSEIRNPGALNNVHGGRNSPLNAARRFYGSYVGRSVRPS